jgi:4-alpha-glucanotransferase
VTSAQASAAAFAELASLHGVQASYEGTDGREHRAEDAVVLAILQALGVPIDAVAHAPDVLREHGATTATRPLQPVLVHRVGRAGYAEVTVPSTVHPRSVSCALACEDGSERRWPLSASVVGMAADVVGGTHTKRYRLALEPDGQEPIAPGYHRFAVEWPGAAFSALLISAPACPQSPRAWGAFLPLHALRTDDDWGVGSYTDMAALGRWIGELGGSMLGALPLYPAFLDPPADPSPYLPVSRLAYNDVFVDPTALPELGLAPEARRLLASDAFRRQVSVAHHATLVDYEAVALLRRQVLEPMAAALIGTASSRRDAFRAFVHARPELAAYARFRATGDRVGHRTGALAHLPESDADAGPTVDYHLYAQWVAATQLGAAADASSLYADLPIGVHPEGFDPLWAPRSFVPGVHGGAPPDLFFAGGQDWSFPPLHPAQMRDDGYAYFAAVLRRAMSHAAFLRVDHIMGLQRLYWIPEGFGAQHGAYVSYRADELHAVVSLEAFRAGTVVVGEDLGTVPDGVRQRMAEDRMLRSWVLQFESTATEPLPDPHAGMLASWGTHDLPRFAAYLWGDDIDEREANGQLSQEAATVERTGRGHWRHAFLRAVGLPEAAHGDDVTIDALRACLAHLATSAADLVLVDLEELWGERQPQNRPGTGTEAANWRQRANRTLAAAQRDSGTVDFLRRLDQLRVGTPSPASVPAAPAGPQTSPATGAPSTTTPTTRATTPAGPSAPEIRQEAAVTR